MDRSGESVPAGSGDVDPVRSPADRWQFQHGSGLVVDERHACVLTFKRGVVKRPLAAVHWWPVRVPPGIVQNRTSAVSNDTRFTTATRLGRGAGPRNPADRFFWSGWRSRVSTCSPMVTERPAGRTG